LIDHKFGLLTVLQYLETNHRGEKIWWCKCNCGNKIRVNERNFKTKKSCGCIKIARSTNFKPTHGLSKHGLYAVWHGMKQRCLNPNHTSFKHYGGRGITIHEFFLTFENFHSYMVGIGWKKGLQIDRIDNDGDYAPYNVRCVTPKQNAQNKVRKYD